MAHRSRSSSARQPRRGTTSGRAKESASNAAARREDVAIRQHDEVRGLEETAARRHRGRSAGACARAASRCAAASTPSASASVAGRPAITSRSAGIGQAGERVQQRVDALVAAQLAEAHEDAVLGAEPQRAPRLGRRHVVRIAADVVPVRDDGRRPAAPRASRRAQPRRAPPAGPSGTRNQRSARSTAWRLVRQRVVDRPHDAVAAARGRAAALRRKRSRCAPSAGRRER